MERGENDTPTAVLGEVEAGSIITARGTGDGLVIRLDGRADAESLKSAFTDFISSRKRFLSGNDVSLEWIGGIPSDALIDELSLQASQDFNINVKASSLKEVNQAREKSAGREGRSSGLKSEIEIESSSGLGSTRGLGKATASDDLGLFGGVDTFEFEEESRKSSRGAESKSWGPTDSNLWDHADARIIFSTIRSGQKIETEHSIVIFGDVNSGAELIAGGDIVVLGTLRGVAHAGAYDETGGGRVIFALNLQPTQLRIGMVISRGAAGDSNRGPEIARVDGGMIVVESYHARGTLSRRRDI